MRIKHKVRGCLTLLAVFCATSFSLSELNAADKAINKKKSGMYIGGFYAPSNMMLPKINTSGDSGSSSAGGASINIDDSVTPALPATGTINLPGASGGNGGILLTDKSEWANLGIGGEIGYNFGNFSVGALIDYRKYEDDSTSSDSGTSDAGGTSVTTLFEAHESAGNIDPLAYDTNHVFTAIPLNIQSIVNGTYTGVDNRAVRYVDSGADGGITNNTLNIIDVKDSGESVNSGGILSSGTGTDYDITNSDGFVSNGQLGQSDSINGRLLGFKAVSTGTTTSVKISKMEKTFLGAVADYNINISPKFTAFIGAGAGVDIVKGTTKITGGGTTNIYATKQTDPISAFEATGTDAIYKFTPETPEGLMIYKLAGSSEYIHEGQKHPSATNNYALTYKLSGPVALTGENGPTGTANSLLVAKYSEPFMLDESKLPAHNMQLADEDYDDATLIGTYTFSDIDVSKDFDTSVFAMQGRVGIEYRISDSIAPYATYTARYSASKDITVNLDNNSSSDGALGVLDITSGEIAPHTVNIAHTNCDLTVQPGDLANILQTPVMADTVTSTVDTTNKVTITVPSDNGTMRNTTPSSVGDKSVKVSIPNALDHVFAIGVKFYF
ncbi:hypothetical protein GUI12_02510 [Anaplasmataceae bacterium AB001_6]|nr:hypothetical protein GUI12_02510 [Anaplasmataceae bacterium AB001_6]